MGISYTNNSGYVHGFMGLDQPTTYLATPKHRREESNSQDSRRVL